MKKVNLLALMFLLCNVSIAQEWFTYFDVAKRMALTENKFLFVLWESSLDQLYPVTISDGNGNSGIIDLSVNNDLDALIWEHFIPVFLSESNYEDLFKEIKGKRSTKYINKFNDDSIKIMDVNGNILNANSLLGDAYNLTSIINKYGLSTTFLKQDLSNYLQKRNFVTVFNLSAKYTDYAIFVNNPVRKEVIALATIYLEEAKVILEKDNTPKKEALLQRIQLLNLKQELILNKPKKTLRLLKKKDAAAIEDINKAMYAFLHYTANKLIKDDTQATLWQEQLSEVDLKKAELILNINE